ncbi:MAG: LysR family transcriptional regulator [Rubrivivax sp.]|nr:LysR family transcriptional regulator [Rubrivivax sp.]
MAFTIQLMDQSRSSLADVALFVEVARTASFRLAATRLEMPPSTLSRRIAALEVRLGVALFVRTTRSVALTSAAKPYFERCLEVIEAAERAQAALDTSQDQQMRMRIAMPVDLGVEMLGPAVATFADAHRGLKVEFDLSSRAVDLLRDPVDLALRIGKPMDDRVVARKVGEIASGLYAAPGLLRRLPPITAPQQLADLPCLDLRTALGSMPWQVGAAHWDAAPGPCALAANSVALLCRLAEDGRGIALLPRHVAARRVQARSLEHLLAGEATPNWPIYAVTANRHAPRLVKLLIAHIKAALASVP